MRDAALALLDAAGTGEIVRVRYMGGTQPGATRDLQVLKVDGLHALALCLATAEVKTYRLDRAEVVGASAPLTYVAGLDPGLRFVVLGDLAREILPLLQRPEWHAESNSSRIAVFARFKNGKPRKRPLAAIELAADKSRPWRVSGGIVSRAYGRLDRAGAAFLARLEIDASWPVAPPRAPRKATDDAVRRRISRMGDEPYRPVFTDPPPESPAPLPIPPFDALRATPLVVPALPRAPRKSWLRRALGWLRRRR